MYRTCAAYTAQQGVHVLSGACWASTCVVCSSVSQGCQQCSAHQWQLLDITERVDDAHLCFEIALSDLHEHI